MKTEIVLDFEETIKNLKKNSAGLIIEYSPVFCRKYIEYAGQNLRPDGFYAEYNISKRAADEWRGKYSDWDEAIDHGRYAVEKLLNDNVKALLNILSPSEPGTPIPDNALDMYFKLSMKAHDISIQMDKGTGYLKDLAKDRNFNKKKKVNSNNKFDEAMETYFNSLDK